MIQYSATAGTEIRNETIRFGGDCDKRSLLIERDDHRFGPICVTAICHACRVILLQVGDNDGNIDDGDDDDDNEIDMTIYLYPCYKTSTYGSL